MQSAEVLTIDIYAERGTMVDIFLVPLAVFTVAGAFLILFLTLDALCIGTVRALRNAK